MQSRAFDLIGGSGVILVALAFWGSQQRAHVTGPNQTPIGFRRETPPTAAEQIELIQSGVRSALDDLSMTKGKSMPGLDAMGNPVTLKADPIFGLERTPMIYVPHDGVLRSTNVPMVGSSFRDPQLVLFYAVSRLGKPLQSGKLTLHKDFGFGNILKPNASAEVVAFAERSRSALRHGDRVKGHVMGLVAEARPIRLDKPECLPCHAGSKVGDPMAILVYTIRRKKA